MPFYLASEKALQDFLESCSVKTSRFGQGNAKPLSWLYQELQEGTCYLENSEETAPASPGTSRRSRLLRVVEPIFIRLRFRGKVLVQEKQKFPDGRVRMRNMLLAEKKEPRDSGGIVSTVHRAIHEELGVSMEDLRRDDVMKYRTDTYHFEIEHIDSPSYPGLASAYRTHHVQVDILETGLDVFMHCGLPEFSEFVTTEKTAHGGITLYWRWDDVATALKRGVVKFPPKSLAPKHSGPRPSLNSAQSNSSIEGGKSALTPALLPDANALAKYLKLAGIDPDLYGKGKAKSIESLRKEVLGGETVLEWNEATSEVRRIVEPVFVQFRWNDKVLVEHEQVLADGRTRSRNMLLAEKKKPEDGDVEQTVYRGLMEELLEKYKEQIPEVAFHVRFMNEAYCCLAENLESNSYPGIPCVYITHYCSVQLLDSSVPVFQELGFLETEFSTHEEDGKINRWRWVELEEARNSKVKGFPQLEENKDQETDAGVWQQVEVPDNPGDLRVLLEFGGVNVSTWGMFTKTSLESLLSELKNGASTLEREEVSGKVRRVICSSLVQLKVDGIQENEQVLNRPDGSRAVSQQGFGFGLGDARSMVNFRADRGVWELTHSDSSSYPGLPCCYQTKLVQFEAQQSEQMRKMPSDVSMGGKARRNSHGRENGRNSGLAFSQLSVPSCGPMSPKSAESSLPGSLNDSPARSRQNMASDPLQGDEISGIYKQVASMHKDLRFRMVAKEASEKKPPPATNAVACSCEILLIRNINPMTATYQCRFFIFLEWFDPAAIGLPPGDVSEENRKKLSVPEIALQNTLKTGVEIHYPPEIIFSEKGHVAIKVLYQAIMQMEIDMRLFPFDTQRLNIVLGLRARRDRDRAVFCRFCHVDSQITLDEWKLLGAHSHADRPDGRARVQFGVVIGRGYMYYVLNVLLTLCAIASSSFAGYLLQLKPPFDRLRFCISILFAQTTFRLSIDSKLPIVAYATAFDHFAMCCQLLLLSIILGDVIVVMLADRWFGFGGEETAQIVDLVFISTLLPLWILALVGFSVYVARKRKKMLQGLNVQTEDGKGKEENELPDFSPEAIEQIGKLRGRLRYTSARRLSPTINNISTDAVAVSTVLWFIHDIDPIQAQYECKFSLYIEWICEDAVGLPEGIELSKSELVRLRAPEVDVHNKVELALEQGPSACVTDSSTGRIMLTMRYHAKLQLRLKLRNFPFDEQSLPIDITMPSEKDVARAFVFRQCELMPLCHQLDEWTVQGTAHSCSFHEGMSQASMSVKVRRNSKYYVVSVLMVMLGISSLVFTVFSIEVNSVGKGFDDQGKILIPLLMTLLAFKLLTASGKIPKVAKATIFDRYVLASEACFFVTVFSCSTMRAIIASPGGDEFSGLLRLGFCLVLLLAWVVFNLIMVAEVRRKKVDEDDIGPRSSVHVPGFDELAQKILATPLLPETTQKASAILMEVCIKHAFAINPAAANFTCEFEVTLAWLDPRAKTLETGEKLDEKRCAELGLPKLAVQNAQGCNIKYLSGLVVDSSTGHVACKLKIKAQVLMMFDLRYFPWDEQSLFMVLMLASREDAHRHFVLTGCTSRDAVKAGEWEELASFGRSYALAGSSKAVFGLQIKRHSRYYVTSLCSLMLWSTFILLVYALAVNDFRERGKIMVGVLLVQNVAKVAVSSKMPRVVRITAYDNVALNSLALLFSIGIFCSFFDALGQLELPGLTYEVLSIIDHCWGCFVFLVWIFANIWVMVDVRRNSSEAQAVKQGKLPRSVQGLVPPDFQQPSEVEDELKILGRTMEGLLTRLEPPVRKTRSRSSDALCDVPVHLGVKFWLVSDIDVASATFLAKFHVILEWSDEAAVGLPRNTRISYTELLKESNPGAIAVPKIGLKNAITVSLEEYSDVIVLDSEMGRVTVRVHFNASVFTDFCLDSFPFDCQRLAVEVQLVNCEGFVLVPSFCDPGDQTKKMDGWNLRGSCLAQSGVEDIRAKHLITVLLLVERQWGFYVKQVLSIYWFLTTLMFSFFVLSSGDFTKRLVDILKIVLTQTTFRFSVEHRLPKVQHWTPFDAYLISCQILCCLIVAAFLICFFLSKNEEQACLTQEIERAFLVGLASVWVLWNVGYTIYAMHRKRRELYLARLFMNGALMLPSRFSSGLMSRYSTPQTMAPQTSLVRHKQTGATVGEDEEMEDPLSPQFSRRETGGTALEAFTDDVNHETQVISIAFRIWLIRNVDLVKATFECKFRVFLEWLDEAAVGLEKGKKAKELKVPSIAITNAVQAEVLDRSSAPEVVNPATGHIAVQMLFRATLRMDQQVRHFPFDCQWLAITVSLKEEGCARNRSFLFQYCEVDEGLSLDEWFVCPDPAFSTLTKQSAPSIQDTVMCGLLIRRASRYYVVNIMLMLGLISSIAFAIYTVHVSLFWERAEVFLGIFPLIVIFKMSAQAKLPRVGYSTKFDAFATACQMLFLVIVMGCMAASFISNLPHWLKPCDSFSVQAFEGETMLADIEHYCCCALIGLWLAWVLRFSWQARQAQRLTPVQSMQSRVPVKLQGQSRGDGSGSASMEGLAPSLSVVAEEERKRSRARPSLLATLGLVSEK